jgi:hypothetical protein
MSKESFDNLKLTKKYGTCKDGCKIIRISRLTMSGFILFLVLLNFAFAMSNIHSVDLGTNDEPVLVFLNDGRVIRRDRKEALKDPIINKYIEEKKASRNQKSLIRNEYYKTVLPNIRDVEDLFQNGRRDYLEDSQCYQRAHIWAYEWRNMNIYSSKTWIFFTRRYIRKYNFEWWFHVAPSVHVSTDEGIKERVLDLKYASAPLKLKSWSDIFIRDGSDCPVVEKYTDQADYPESSSCFVMKSSMYYYQPFELELEEINGIEKNTWIREEVKQSYLQAFKQNL